MPEPQTNNVVSIPERNAVQTEMLLRFGDALATQMRVALPAKVVTWNPLEQTITAQPLVREKLLINGVLSWVDLPILQDVPVQFAGGGGLTLTFPLVPGDECLIVFGDMDMSEWWANGGVQNWVLRRRHDLSDAYAIPGIRSKPNVIPNISSTAAELRNAAGTVKVSVDGDSADVTAPTVTMTATNVNITGVLTINGQAYTAHRHSGVQTGIGNTGGVV